MSLHYLLDGYNILHQMPRLTELDIDQQRLILVREIEKQRPHGRQRNQITIYFDGRPGPVQPIQSSVVKVQFTYDDTADDRIKTAVHEASNSRNIVVVTDDRAIQYAVRAYGAKVWTVKEFLDRLNKTSAGSGSSSGSNRGISAQSAEQINSELEDIWLRKKSDE